MRRARHGYYAAVSYLDERVGEVLDALAATGLDRDTIVVFTSDHGEFLGERGLWYKMSFLEASARVPLHRARAPGSLPGASRGRSRSSTSPPRSPSSRARRPTRRGSRAAAWWPRCAAGAAAAARRSGSISRRACARPP